MAFQRRQRRQRQNMDQTRYKVVLVDDNMATLNQGKNLLKAFYRVQTIQSPATLFENLENDTPDLILLDVEMPEMNGFEVIKKLKSDVRYKNIPVIFLTSKSDEEHEREGFSLGAVDYIAKPFSGPLLQKRISNQILYKRVQNAVKDYSSNLEIMLSEIDRANERTRILLDKTPLCARLWDNNYNVIDCNEAAVTLFGFEDKKQCMERYSELYPEYQPDGQRSAEKVTKCIEKAFENGRYEFEWTYKMLDGTLMPAEVVLVRVEYGDDYAVAGYTRDLRAHNKMMAEIEFRNNQLKTAIEKALEDEERIRLILDAMPLACRLIGKDYKFIECNQEALNLVGAKNREEYLEKFDELFPEFQPCGRRSRELRMEHLKTAFEKGYARFEWMYRTLAGKPLPCEITMVRIMYKGEYIIAGYARDLREQKAVIEEMRKAEIAEESNKAKSRFLATMSHEIRTPMNSIMGFAELALGKTASPQVGSYLMKILDSTKWLLRIVNDILDISKIEAGKMDIEKVPFDLNDVIARCQSVIMPTVKGKDLYLEIHTEPPVGKKLIGDSFRLYQALVNLLSNAVKFTNTGTIQLSSLVKNITDNRATVYFEIRDSGIGMNSEQLEKVFESFIQADSSTTRNYGGTGLGLTIAENIVELMGGRLMAESSPDVGSVFSFEMVFETVDDVVAATNENVELKELKKPHFEGLILVCDDNLMNQEVICEHLAEVGLNTMVAGNGKISVEMVSERAKKNEKPFNLIFMDIFMPVMDGLEAASKITKLNTGSPIVAVTANVATGAADNYRKHGMSDCLGKPFTAQELWHILLKYLTPVSNAIIDDDERAQSGEELQNKLRITFAKNNQTKYAEIAEAIDSGDTTLAHRLVHTLKGSAGLIGKTVLQNIAADVEAVLKKGTIPVPADKMNLLKNELTRVVKELASLLDEPAAKNNPLNNEQIRALFAKLEPLLKSRNSSCINLLADIRAVPGAEKLAQQIEEYDFKLADVTFAELKKAIDNAFSAGIIIDLAN